MEYSSERNHGCRILEYTHRGLKFITMENELLKISIIADKGAEIYQIIYKPMDVDFMWKTPNGIKEAGKYIPTSASSLGSYFDYFAGGWQEILPGGGPATYKGAEIGLHGELTVLPWNYTIKEDTEDKISVTFTCRTVRFPFLVKKNISLTSNSSVILFEESLKNEAEEDLEFLWGQHPAFGAPFIDGNCRIDIPAKEFETSDFYDCPTAMFDMEHKGKWPVDTGKNGERFDLSKVPSGEKPISDLMYLKGMEEGWYAITNTNKKLGFGVCWDISVYPYAVYWLGTKGAYGYPWYGRSYVFSLEFWNSFTDKLSSAKANGTIKTIKARQTIETSYKAVIYTGVDKVNRITPEGVIE